MSGGDQGPAAVITSAAAAEALGNDSAHAESDAESNSEVDSGYWSPESSTQSVSSSVYNWESSYGRTYHSYHAGKYQLPNDTDEQERIDIKYHAVRLALMDRLFFAPVQNPKAILDIGTGTGIWAMDTADAYPEAVVIGTDLSPIQPNYVPPNLQFEIADADEDWLFTQNFDLVHCRIMNDYTLKSWPHYFEQAFLVIKPGGWVECQEFDYNRRSDDGTIAHDSRLKFWEEEWTRGVEKVGLRGVCNPNLVMEQMRAAGFINVVKLEFKLPIGPWPEDSQLRQAGLFAYVNLLEGLHGLSVKIFTGLLGYSSEQLELLLMQCRSEISSKKIHSYWPLFIIYGQKPGNC